jgi:hypothetical protein
MSFHRSPRHLQLAGNFSVVTTLQKQLDDLLFTWAQPNRLFLHRFPPFLNRLRNLMPGCSLQNPIASTLPFCDGAWL